MRSFDFAKQLGLEPLQDTDKNLDIKGVYIGDLLSIVMSKAKENFVWITIQTHINIVAVAELLDLACIIIAENMDLENDALEKAKELNIPIFKTSSSAYEMACNLYELGIK